MYGRLSHVSLSSSYFDPDDFTTSAWEKEEEERREAQGRELGKKPISLSHCRLSAWSRSKLGKEEIYC